MDYSSYFWQGDKVRLRPVRPDDAEQVYADMLDSPARRVLQLGVELPTSVEAQRTVLEKYADCKDVDGVRLLAIETTAGEYVGGISMHSRYRKNGTFGLGMIISRSQRGKGYGVEAGRIVLRYMFHERRYQKCNSACVEINDASISFHKKIGFVEEGRRRRQLYLNGRYYDDLLFGMTREEFDATFRTSTDI